MTCCGISRTPSTVIAWLVALTLAVMFLLFRTDRAQNKLNLGDRFTFQDAQLFCEAHKELCQISDEKLLVIYGDKVTPFRRYLESKNP